MATGRRRVAVGHQLEASIKLFSDRPTSPRRTIRLGWFDIAARCSNPGRSRETAYYTQRRPIISGAGAEAVSVSPRSPQSNNGRVAGLTVSRPEARLPRTVKSTDNDPERRIALTQASLLLRLRPIGRLFSTTPRHRARNHFENSGHDQSSS